MMNYGSNVTGGEGCSEVRSGRVLKQFMKGFGRETEKKGSTIKHSLLMCW